MQDKDASCDWFEWADQEEMESAMGLSKPESQAAEIEAAESLPQEHINGSELDFVKVCLQLEENKRKNDKLERKIDDERFKKNVAFIAVALSWVVTLVMYCNLGKA